MAVNLKATATLNTKPYMASLKSLSSATSKLNKSAIKGNQEVSDSLTKQIAAREAASRAATSGAKTLTSATNQSNRTMRQAAVNADAYNKSLEQTQRMSKHISDSYAKMTPAMARHNRAVIDLARAQTALAKQSAQGLEGPALERYQKAVDRAAHSVGRARAAVIADNEKVATSTKKAADAQLARNNALTAGANAASSYARTASSMSQEQLKLASATERLGAAEGRLASAVARSNGMITPAVQSARAGVLSAQSAYNKLAEAQLNVAETGGRAANGLAAQRYLFHDVSRQALGLGLALGAVPAAAVVAGAAWENQFADVIRTADYDLRESPKRIEALRTSLVGMAETMPVSFGAITEIATLGNQMGVQAHELDGFTKSVAMFSATSGIAVEEAATAFGRLRTVASDANFSFMGVADSILKVGVNSVATEQEIINVTTQISSIAASAGFTTEEMIGLSGALASVRVPPELSRSIITRTFGQFDKAIQKNGTELSTLARVSGRSIEDIKKNWGGPGAADIFVDFTNGLRKSGRQARMELEALGITSVRDVPALMRLANAADSTGKKGGLLSQTINDARNAAGEVQGQYAIMADTVVGRLKVLGNSVLSFFNTLGSGSNAFIKGAIDGLTNMFQVMEKIVDNPFSSWALGALAAVSGIALVTAGMAKLTASVKMFQHVGSVLGAGSFFSAIGMSKKGGGAGALAEMSPMLVGTASLFNSFKSGAAAAGTSWKNLGSAISSTAAAWTIAGKSMRDTGLGAKNLGTAISQARTPIPATTGALANLARFGLSPVGIGLAAVATVGVFAYKEWSKGFHMTSTSASELAESLSKVDMTSMGEVSKVLKNIAVSGTDVWQPWKKGFKPFADGMPGLIRDLEIYTKFQEDMARAESLGSHAVGGSSWDKQALRNDILSKGIDPAAFSKGLSKLDESFKEMRAAGNDAAVTGFWTKFGEGATNSADRVTRMKRALEKMPEEAAALTNQFALQGMTLDQGLQNFNKLSREMRDVAAEFDGASIIADSFGLSDQEAATFGKVLNEAAAAFIDFNSALEAGTKTDDNGVFTGFSLGDFNQSLVDSMEAQGQWMNVMRSLVTETAPDVIEALSSMGPAGLELGKSLVDGLASADPEVRAQAEQTLKTFEDAAYASKIDFGPNLAEYSNVMEKAGAMLGKDAGTALNSEIAASLQPEDWTALSSGINAVIDQHGPELGGRLGKRLFENLNAGSINADQFSTLSEAFGAMGYNASKSLMDALENGVSMDQVMARIARIQTPKIPIEIEADSKAAGKITQSFKDMFGANGVEVPANFSLDSTMGELRTALGQPGLLPNIEADLTLNEIIAQGQLDGFRAWALSQGIDVELMANPNAAYLTLNSFEMLANGTITTAQLDAMPEPANGKLMEFVTLASGTQAVVQVDAESGMATGKIWELDGWAKNPVWKPVDAETGEAKAAIKDIDAAAEAKKTKKINVTDDGTAAGVQASINAITGKTVKVVVNEVQGTKVSKQANGSVLQFYADGGVRENHTAQIAPAGAMRVWAEPETGGEAYIPLAQSKRARSEAILNDVATRFGYALQPQNYTKFADGGHYMAQAMSRQRFAQASARGTGTDAKVNIGEVRFTQENQKDQFREFTRHVNRVARGL